MRVTPECLPCLRRLIEMTADAASPADEIRERAVREAWDVVMMMKDEPLSAAHLANRFFPVIKDISGNADPFALRKRQEMSTASGLATSYAPPADASFRRFVSFSLQGNAIDFFRPVGELEHWLQNPAPPIAVDDIDLLAEGLRRGSRSILWLADNAGEVFFDLPLLEALRAMGHRVFYAVKGGPIQNDVTAVDLERWPRVFASLEIVGTGAATVGVELNRVSKSFARLYNTVDLILAKGMGHFETMGEEASDPRLFFLLMAKCGPVARALGAPLNHFAACFAGSLQRGERT